MSMYLSYAQDATKSGMFSLILSLFLRRNLKGSLEGIKGSWIMIPLTLWGQNMCILLHAHQKILAGVVGWGKQ